MVTVKSFLTYKLKRSSIKYLFLNEKFKLLKRNKWPLFYFIWAWFRLNLKLNYIKHLNNCYQLVTWEWYSKFPYAWRIISTSKTKLSENYVLCWFIILSVTATMLNTLVKPNDIKEREPRNILVSHHSQGYVLKPNY